MIPAPEVDDTPYLTGGEHYSSSDQFGSFLKCTCKNSEKGGARYGMNVPKIVQINPPLPVIPVLPILIL